MKEWLRHIRQPVQRERAQLYVFYMLLSFAVSVTLTRTFLQLTGYPQIGNSDLHIAHVLWGGLLLFIASLLPIIFANRWVYPLSAILGGAGVGLFIDEVGKFVTQTNDYFSPLAAPIIYALFLLTTLIYLSLRRPTPRSARSELYRSLEGLLDVIEHDLDEQERAILDQRLCYVVATADSPDMRALAESLLNFLATPTLQVTPHKPLPAVRFATALKRIESRWFSRRIMRATLAIAFCLIGAFALIDLMVTLVAFFSPGLLEELAARLLATQPQVRGASSLTWALVRAVLEGAIGVFLLLGGVLLALGREELGTRLAYFGLLIALTMVNLLVFYFDQFSAIVSTFVQFSLLLAVLRYRMRFVNPQFNGGFILPKVSA